MSDKIYEDSITVSSGPFIIRTQRDKLGGRAIYKSKSSQRLDRLTDSDLVDLHSALSEYLHMMGMSQ